MSLQEDNSSPSKVAVSPKSKGETGDSSFPEAQESPHSEFEPQSTEESPVTAVPPTESEDSSLFPSETSAVADQAEEQEISPAPEPLAREGDSLSESLDPGEIQNLMESLESAPTLVQGEIVQGRVLKLTDDEVFVDLGLKSEGVISRSEFLAEDGQLTVAAGDSIDVLVEKFDETTGTAELSRRKAVQEKLWEEVERAFHEESPIEGRVTGRIKGGLTVDIGVRAFLPASQADLKPHTNLEHLIGQTVTCKVINLDRKRDNVVVSRRKLLEEENERKKATLLAGLAEGAVLTGRVKNLTDYGAFVDLGGIDGLLHLTDLSWTRLAHPSEAVQVGQEIRVQVLKYDKEKERVSLGLKQLSADPWQGVASRFKVGDQHQGNVVSVTDYGAFVELEPGVEGLIHISEMSWSKRLRHPSKILKPGDRVDVAILDVRPDQRRISLSLKQTLEDPWAGVSERLGVGTVVRGRVRHFTDFGAFVEVEEGVDGLIHISNLSWSQNVKHPSEVLRKGQQIEAVVLKVDPEERRLSLGLKQLQPDVWENFFAKTSVGDVVHAKVTRRTSFGIFAEIEEGIEALCHISEIEDHRPGSEKGLPKVGSELDFRVIRLNPEEKKIGLSMRLSESEPLRERERPRETPSLSRMAEAFSSAGITTPAMSRALGSGNRGDS